MSESSATHPHATLRKRLTAVLLWSLMAVVFGVTGWFFGIQPLAIPIGNWMLARDYQPVEATVVERKGTDAEGEFSWNAALYEVAGKSYQTERLTVLDDEAIDEPANAVVLKAMTDARTQDKKVTVWVSPRKPDIALISRDLPLGSMWSRLPFSIVFGVFALAGAFGAIGALAGFAYYRRMLDASGLWLFGAVWCGILFPVLLMVTSQPNIEWVALIVVGVFAFFGLLMVYGAVAASITGKGGTPMAGLTTSRASTLNKAALATSWGKKGKPVKGEVKRGGVGGRGADFDKD